MDWSQKQLPALELKPQGHRLQQRDEDVINKRIATFFIMDSFDFKCSETYKKLPNNVGVSFINKKARFIDHTVYI